MSRSSRHDNQEGFNWSLEGLPEDQLLRIQSALDAADATFSEEMERIRASALRAQQRAANKLRRDRAEILFPYRILPSKNPQERMTATMREILQDVTENGPQRYNGLMEKPIRALQRLGLVNVSYDFLPSAIGRGRRVFTVSLR